MRYFKNSIVEGRAFRCFRLTEAWSCLRGSKSTDVGVAKCKYCLIRQCPYSTKFDDLVLDCATEAKRGNLTPLLDTPNTEKQRNVNHVMCPLRCVSLICTCTSAHAMSDPSWQNHVVVSLHCFCTVQPMTTPCPNSRN